MCPDGFVYNLEVEEHHNYFANGFLVHNCHHFVSDDWRKPIEHMKASGTGLLGLTATPDRGDGRGLAPLFDDLIVVAQPRELIAQGYLVPCRVMSPPQARKSLAEHPVQAYLYYAKGRKTIVFCGTVAYARKLAGEFEACGVRAACVDGNMDDRDRARTIAKFRAGDIDVLTSVAVLTEGFDAPETSCIITTTGASSPGPAIQKVGRGMRPAPGKVDCLHLDLRGMWHGLGMLPDEDREFALDGRAITGSARSYGDAVVQCRGCGCWFRANEFKHSTCPECGCVRKGREDPHVRRARLALIADGDMQQDRVEFLVREYFSVAGKRKKSGEPYKAFGYALQRFMVKYRRRANEREIAGFRAFINAAKTKTAKPQGDLFA